jgi:hypothetical protein
MRMGRRKREGGVEMDVMKEGGLWGWEEGRQGHGRKMGRVEGWEEPGRVEGRQEGGPGRRMRRRRVAGGWEEGRRGMWMGGKRAGEVGLEEGGYGIGMGKRRAGKEDGEKERRVEGRDEGGRGRGMG